MALIVPIAAELVATSGGLVAAVFSSLCATAAFWIPVFPYYRLAPVLLAVLGMLRYARSGRAAPLFLAFAASTLGILWSLDTGLYALAGTAIAALALRAFKRRELALAAVAAVLPLLVLLAVRADIRQFVTDSFVIMPKTIDAVWALPAPAPFTANGIRYFVPPIVYGLLLALALLEWRRSEKLRAAQIFIVAIFSILLFRTAAGRVSWSHTRFAVPLLGIACVAFFLEPLVRALQSTPGVRTVRGHLEPDLRPDGTVPGVFSFTEDITKERATEDALRQAEVCGCQLVAGVVCGDGEPHLPPPQINVRVMTDQPLDIGSNLLKFAQRLAAPLVLKNRIRQLKRVANAVGIDLRADPLRDDVGEIILEIFGNTRNKSDADGSAKKHRHTPVKRIGWNRVSFGSVILDEDTHDDRVQHREESIDCCQYHRQRNHSLVAFQIGKKKFHE